MVPVHIYYKVNNNKMSRKYSSDDYKNIIIDNFEVDINNITIIPNNNSRDTKVVLQCKQHGINTWRWQYINININNKQLIRCKKCLIYEDFKNILKSNQLEILSGEYKDAKSRLKFRCLIHNFEFENTRNDLSNHGFNCPKCHQYKWRDKYKKDFLDKATLIHKGIYDYSTVEYQTTREPVNILCNKHGIFKQSPDSHLQGQGCPKCSFSYAEDMISSILDKYHIKFIYNKPHNDLINPETGFRLKPDFLLIDYNIIIEYDGIQHYIPIHGKNNLISVQKLDLLKNKLCEENNIVIWRFNKNNISLLEEKIKKLSNA
jgi:hypothetical protein